MTTTTQTRSPAKLHDLLTRAEVDGSLAGDTRRVLRDERVALGFALRSGDGARIAAAAKEARRVAAMWGVAL